ncbi:hypothetical protein ATE92_0116 [Ulvibacter sp. MAR_2010_11]|uniref:hypothetical protein n=1 Tax=Ulvibacter sp. MAR_2010_11 TaxID=1250229 RepID=UPI000C2CB7E9|nr:hypothetical protein [Ulvibacter sp. MAR_2010_11]PKA81993.1 hypothetical protein ATE92_0116 [Ulvibacter sp. MAR_2010_11]
MITLDYELFGAGWANVTIGNGNSQFTLSYSYLHDSLKELAKSAVQIKHSQSSTIVFVLEPEECQLILNKLETNKLRFELRKYPEWSEYNSTRTNFELLMSGTCTVNNYINEVRNILIGILEKMSPSDYKKKWKLSDFPISEYELLR